jgi:hypothetical protein
MASLTEQYLDALQKRKEDLAAAQVRDQDAQNLYAQRQVQAMNELSKARSAWEDSNRQLAIKDPGTGPNGRDVHAASDAYRGALTGTDRITATVQNQALKQQYEDQNKEYQEYYGQGMQDANHNVDAVNAQGEVKDARQVRQGTGINLGANITGQGPTLANYAKATGPIASNFYNQLKTGGLLNRGANYDPGKRGLDTGLLTAMGYRDYT